MNANAVAKNYDMLTPEERFRLILAAGERRDEAERDRLADAGERITLSMSDHAPFSDAFTELAMLVFIELLDAAAGYDEAHARADEAEAERDAFDVDEPGAGEGDEAGEDPDATAGAESAEEDAGERPYWQRTLDIALAAGFMLKTKAAGWMLFCERMNVSGFAIWEGLPGCDRLRRALELAEKAAFTPEGMVKWLNEIRPAGKPKAAVTAIPSVEGFADACEGMFRHRVKWWSGTATSDEWVLS